jgi:hypothetical protein
MDEKRFQELFADTERWVRQARRLKIAGDHFTPAVVQVLTEWLQDRDGAARQTPEFLEKNEVLRSLTDARALLYGLCIENACKARGIEDARIELRDGAAKRLRSDHNVLEMVKEAGYTPCQEEAEFLGLLAYQTRTMSKYPIAKDLRGQNQFTGRVVGARPEEGEMVERIVVRVLREDRLQSVFIRGHMTEQNLERVDGEGRGFTVAPPSPSS